MLALGAEVGRGGGCGGDEGLGGAGEVRACVVGGGGGHGLCVEAKAEVLWLSSWSWKRW